MTAPASASISDPLIDEWVENPGRPPPQLTLNFGDLRNRFYHLIATTDGMSSGYGEGSEYLDEPHYHRTLDTLTDQLYSVCVNLSTLRSTCRDHLKLKISALLYLLPEEADAELKLAKSLLADLDERQLDLSASGGQ